MSLTAFVRFGLLSALLRLVAQSSRHYDPVVEQHSAPSVACHRYGAPKDSTLRCDDSPRQVIFKSDRQSQQKRNLLIFDIDSTILEASSGFHASIPPLLRRNGTQCLTQSDLDLDLLFLQQPSPFSIVFRNRFLDLLEYLHFGDGFSADLVLYTRATSDYALEIAVGIVKGYNAKFSTAQTDLGLSRLRCFLYAVIRHV